MTFSNETFNRFAEEINKLKDRPGLIHLQNDVDYRIVVSRFTGFEVTEYYDDESDPMIFSISFINESGREDAIEVWDSAVLELDFSLPEVQEEWVPEGLQFCFAALKDESNAIEFYVFK